MVEKMKNEISDKKNIFWALALGVALSLGMYVSLVSHTVYTGVLRQQTEKAIYAIENSSETLESRYVSLKNAVTADLAAAKGFRAITSTKYISRGATGKGLSLHTNF